MTWNEVFCNTFKALSEELGLPPAGKSLVELCRADDADFCQEVVAKGWLFGMQLRSATLGTDPSVQPEVADICVSPQCCTVAIVESERSAVVLSELFPECIWMAYSYPSNFTVDKLAPLQGCVVSIYPHTDPTGCTYVSFLELADQARRLYDIDLSVVSVLEEHASEEQKERCIDILDFITESSP